MSLVEPLPTHLEGDQKVDVLIVDDNAVIRAGLRNVLQTSNKISVIGEASDGEAALAEIERSQPDVVLLDVRMPKQDGLSVVKQAAAKTKILMLTYTDEPEVIREALAEGARGYLVHGTCTPDEIERAILSVYEGNLLLTGLAADAMWGGGTQAGSAAQSGSTADSAGLSKRQREVMELIADGLTNGEIARACFLAEKTVKNHVNQIFAKLGVRTRAEAVSHWLSVETERGPRPWA